MDKTVTLPLAIAKNKLQNDSDLARRLDITVQQAADVSYLRTRARWSEVLETSLIKHIKEGIPYNIMEFGVTKETQQRLIDDAMSVLRFRARMPYLVRSVASLKSKGTVTTEIYHTVNGNYRVLINGNVHPLWCGFDTQTVAKEAISFCFD